jgi:hypothetical protein
VCCRGNCLSRFSNGIANRVVGGFGERWQRGSMWLANQACFSFVLVSEARVEGCSATYGMEVSIPRVLFIALSRGKGCFRDDMAGLITETRRRTAVVVVKPLSLVAYVD